jgi:hypothetical protein
MESHNRESRKDLSVHIEPVVDKSGKPVNHRLSGARQQLSIDGRVVVQGHDIRARHLGDGSLGYEYHQTGDRVVTLEDGRETMCYSAKKVQDTYRRE